MMSAYITNFYEQHQTIIIYLPSTLWLSCKRKLTTVAEDRPVQLAHFEFSRSNCNGLRLNFAKCSKVKWKCPSLRMRLRLFLAMLEPSPCCGYTTVLWGSREIFWTLSPSFFLAQIVFPFSPSPIWVCIHSSHWFVNVVMTGDRR